MGVYDALCDAVKNLDMVGEVRARNELIQRHVISWNQGMEIASAIAALRMLAQKLDELRPSN